MILFSCSFITWWLNLLYLLFLPPSSKGDPTVFAFLVPKIKSCPRSKMKSVSQERIKPGFHIIRLSSSTGPQRITLVPEENTCSVCSVYSAVPEWSSNQMDGLEPSNSVLQYALLLTWASPIHEFAIQMQRTSSSCICSCLLINNSI